MYTYIYINVYTHTNIYRTPAQEYSLVTVTLMLVIKRISPPFTTSYLPLSDTFLNIGGDINAQIDKMEVLILIAQIAKQLW